MKALSPIVMVSLIDGDESLWFETRESLERQTMTDWQATLLLNTSARTVTLQDQVTTELRHPKPLTTSQAYRKMLKFLLNRIASASTKDTVLVFLQPGITLSDDALSELREAVEQCPETACFGLPICEAKPVEAIAGTIEYERSDVLISGGSVLTFWNRLRSMRVGRSRKEYTTPLRWLGADPWCFAVRASVFDHPAWKDWLEDEALDLNEEICIRLLALLGFQTLMLPTATAWWPSTRRLGRTQRSYDKKTVSQRWVSFWHKRRWARNYASVCVSSSVKALWRLPLVAPKDI